MFQATVNGGTPPYTVTWDVTGDRVVDIEGTIVSWTYGSPQIVTITVTANDVNGASTQQNFILTVLPFPPSRFQFDWADYDNNGGVNIFNIATAALCWLKDSGSNNWSNCVYWDFNLNDRIDIGDIATAALQYGTVLPTPYPGEGQTSGLIDDQWLPYCFGLEPLDRAYCEAF